MIGVGIRKEARRCVSRTNLVDVWLLIVAARWVYTRRRLLEKQASGESVRRGLPGRIERKGKVSPFDVSRPSAPRPTLSSIHCVTSLKSCFFRRREHGDDVIQDPQRNGDVFGREAGERQCF